MVSGAGGEADLGRVRTIPVRARDNKVAPAQLAHPPGRDRSFRGFLDGLPDILLARDFMVVVRAIADAAREGRGVVVMMGGHVVKTGLSPVLIDLMERGVITHLASNGSTVIHDYELARWGGTSEDVEAGLADGTFGMAEETGREMNEAIRAGAAGGQGLGEALAEGLAGALENRGAGGGTSRAGGLERAGLATEAASSEATGRPDLSLLLAARRMGIGFTVHAALGADIIHQHPSADGAAIGGTSHRDFRRLAGHLERLEGGVVLNLGSAVIMPEVFLKALTVCRNLHEGRPRGFVAADFDMIRQYRPRMNVVERPTRTGGGVGIQITGHHELMVPLLAWAVVEELDPAVGSDSGEASAGSVAGA